MPFDLDFFCFALVGFLVFCTFVGFFWVEGVAFYGIFVLHFVIVCFVAFIALCVLIEFLCSFLSFYAHLRLLRFLHFFWVYFAYFFSHKFLILSGNIEVRNTVRRIKEWDGWSILVVG